MLDRTLQRYLLQPQWKHIRKPTPDSALVDTEIALSAALCS